MTYETNLDPRPYTSEPLPYSGIRGVIDQQLRRELGDAPYIGPEDVRCDGCRNWYHPIDDATVIDEMTFCPYCGYMRGN